MKEGSCPMENLKKGRIRLIRNGFYIIPKIMTSSSSHIR
jgi:hypothetical protein